MIWKDNEPKSAVSAEEIQATNEELKSTTEELGISREELQSVNEELTRANTELKKKVEEMSAANSDLQNIMAVCDIGTIFLDRSLLIKRVTPLIGELFNITPSDVGLPLSHITDKFSYDGIYEDVTAALETLTRSEREIHTSGGRFYLLRVHPYRTMADQIGGVVLTFIDITARKAADETIRQSETRLRRITNSLPALISYVDQNEQYAFVNDTYTEWFKKPRKEILGSRVSDVIGPRAYEVVKPMISRALAGEDLTFESSVQYSVAGKRSVQVAYMPDIAEDGTVLGFYGLVIDRSELQESRDLLRSTEEKLGLLMEGSVDYGIITINAEGLIDGWNVGAAMIFGHSEGEIIGKPIDVIFTPEDVDHDVPRKEMRKARKMGRAEDERWHLRKEGSRFFASGIMVPMYLGNTLTGYAKILRDLTEQKAREEELRSARDILEMRVSERTKELAETNLSLRSEIEERKAGEKEKISLLKKVVTSQEDERRRIARDLHDQLGQRLTALRLKIAALANAAAENSEIAERVSRLQEIAERIDTEVSFLAWELRPSALDDLGLIEALGAYVKEWSRHFDTPAEFHVNGLMEKRMRPEAETHLYRITQEALNNIVKHADASQVTVLLEKQEDNLLLIIEDNGIGFDATANIRVHRSGKRLGLIGMNERASLIGGGVEIESSVGKGTTIFVKVPFRTQRNKN